MLKILIIGADHYNTLGAVRGIGKEYKDYEVLILGGWGSGKDTMIDKSKFGRNRIYVCHGTEAGILDFLLRYARNQSEKVVLFPCTDLDMYTVDKHYEELKEHYNIPGFKSNPGKVSFLMDKYRQKEFAASNGIPMADTWSINIWDNEFPENLTYPCIIKPEASVEGSKSDVAICRTRDDLAKAVTHYRDKKYKRAIVQKFLEKKFEVCAFGAILEDGGVYGGFIKKIREYPPGGGGSLTFAQFINDKDIRLAVDKVLDLLRKEGYRGNYDVEFLVCEDGVYLNEINFRHSGNGYALIKAGLNAPLYWCMEAMGEKIPTKKKNVDEGFMLINDTTDFRHVLEHRMSIFRFATDFFKAKAHSVIDVSDVRGTIGYLMKAAGK